MKNKNLRKKKILVFLTACMMISSLFLITVDNTAAEESDKSIDENTSKELAEIDELENENLIEDNNKDDVVFSEQVVRSENDVDSFELNIDYPDFRAPKTSRFTSKKINYESEKTTTGLKSDPSLMGVEKNGTISSDETWTAANSPYWITNDLTIEDGTTLAIEPGVRVIFNGSYSIFVEGLMKAAGEVGNGIIFTSNLMVPSPGDWNSIVFNSTGNGYLQYCNISYATNGVIKDTQNNIQITNCHIYATQKHGIVSYHGGFEISDNEFDTVGWAVLVDIHYVGYSSITIDDMVLTGNEIDSPNGFHFQNVWYESPLSYVSFNVGRTLINNNTFKDVHAIGGGIGILLSNYTVTNMTNGQMWWDDIIVTNNTVNYTTDAIGAIGLFPFGPNFLYNLTDCGTVELGNLIFADNEINTINEGIYVSPWSTIDISGNTNVNCGMAYVNNNTFKVNATAITVESSDIGIYTYDKSSINVGTTLILNNTIHGGETGISFYLEDAASYMYDDSQFYMDDIVIQGNHINSIVQEGIMVGMENVGNNLEQNSYADMSSLFIHQNNIEESNNGVYLGYINEIGSYCSGNSFFDIDGIAVLNNTITSDRNGIHFRYLWRIGYDLEDDAGVDIDSIMVVNNTLETGNYGVGLDNFNEIGVNLNLDTPGQSTFDMEHFLVYGNEIVSHNESIYLGNLTQWGNNLYNYSSVKIGGIISYQNNLTSMNGDGLYISSIAERGNRLYDNATATFWDLIVQENKVKALQGYGVNAVNVFSSSGNMLYHYSSAELGNISFNSNDIKSNLTSIHVGRVENIGNQLYGESTIELGHFSFRSNIINSTNEHGINLERFYGNGYRMYDDSICNLGKIMIEGNEVEAANRGILLSHVMYIGADLTGYSFVDFAGIEVFDNDLYTGYSGIDISELRRVGYSCDRDSSVVMGDISIHDNMIDSHNYGIRLYVSEVGNNLEDNVNVDFGYIDINGNTVRALGRGIFVNDISYLGYKLNMNTPGLSSVTIAGLEISHNIINSGLESIVLEDIYYWGSMMYNDSSVICGDIICDSNDIVSSDEGIYVPVLGNMGYDIYDNSSFKIGNIGFKQNIVDADDEGMNFGNLFYQVGYLMNDDSEVNCGFVQIKDNDIESRLEGLIISSLEQVARNLWDGSIFYMEDFEVSYNMINSSDDRGIYLRNIDYIGENFFDYADATVGSIKVNNNTIGSELEGIYSTGTWDIGSYLHDDSKFKMNNIEFNGNEIVSRSSKGIDLDGIDYFAHELYQNATSNMGQIWIGYNIIDSEMNGIETTFQRLGYGMNDYSIGNIEDIMINYNEITSNRSGIDVDFIEIGRSMYNYSEFKIGDIEISYNMIQVPGTGILTGFSDHAVDMYGSSFVEINQIQIDSNTINAGITGVDFNMSDMAEIFGSNYVGIPNIFYSDNTIYAGMYGLNHTVENIPIYLSLSSRFNLNTVYITSSNIEAGRVGVNFDWNGPHHIHLSKTFRISYSQISGSGSDSTGVYLDDLEGAYDVWIRETDIDNYTDGIYVNSTTIERCWYNTITNTTGDSFILSNVSTVSIVNTQFDQSNVTFNDFGSILEVAWHIHVNVETDTGQPIPYADVIVEDNFGSEVFNGTADENGEVDYILCPDYDQNRTGITIDYNDYSLKASKAGLSSTKTVTVDESKVVPIVILDDVSPVITDETTVSPTTGENFTVDVSVDDNIGVDEVYLEYYFETTSGTTATNNVSMEHTSGKNYSFELTAPFDGLTVYYDAKANDTSNNWVSTGWITLGIEDNDDPVANAGTAETIGIGENYTFDGSTSSDNIGIVNYTWEFEYDSSSVVIYGEMQEFEFKYVGEYVINLTVRDAAGNTDVDNVTVLVIDDISPTADAGNDQDALIDDIVIFNGSGSSDNVGIVNYTWTFSIDDENIILYGIHPEYIFNNTGEYVVTLMVQDENGNNDTDTMNITVIDDIPPTADAGSDQDIGIGDTSVFDASESTDNVGITNYTWSFIYDSEEIELYGETSSYMFDIVGTYSVQLSVTDAAGNNDTDTVVIEVIDDISPTVDAGPDQIVDAGDEVVFDSSNSTDNVGITNYTWSFIYDGEEVMLYGHEPSFVFETPGEYEITLNCHDAEGNEGTDSVVITVVDEVDPTADAGDDVTVDIGDSVNLDGSGSSDNVEVSEYTWTFTVDGVDEELTGVEPTYQFNTIGEYVVTLTVSDEAGNIGTDTMTVEVVHSMDDFDGDGIPNEWEEEYGLDPWDPSDADSDDDDDGLDNLEEYEKETDPNNPDTDGDGIDDGEDDEPLTKQKDEDEDEDGGMMNWLLPIIGVIIIIMAIIALIIWKRKPSEDLEEEDTEELEEEIGEEETVEEGSFEEPSEEASSETEFIEDEDMEEEL